MLSYCDEGDDLYSLSRLPIERLVWGPDKKLWVRGGKAPVTLWTVGYTKNLWFFDSEGDPQSKVAIGVSPVTSHAMNIARAVMGHSANPPYGK